RQIHVLFLLLIRAPPISPLFPSTPLFRSGLVHRRALADLVRGQGREAAEHGEHPPLGDRDAEALGIAGGEGARDPVGRHRQSIGQELAEHEIFRRDVAGTRVGVGCRWRGVPGRPGHRAAALTLVSVATIFIYKPRDKRHAGGGPPPCASTSACRASKAAPRARRTRPCPKAALSASSARKASSGRRPTCTTGIRRPAGPAGRGR